MSDFHWEEAKRHTTLIRHHEALWGYTRDATRKAVAEIRTGCDALETPLRDVMLQRADELEAHLQAIEETLN